MFTVEEITLLRSFDTSTRRTAILSLMNEMGIMQDEIWETAKEILARLATIQ